MDQFQEVEQLDLSGRLRGHILRELGPALPDTEANPDLLVYIIINRTISGNERVRSPTCNGFSRKLKGSSCAGIGEVDTDNNGYANGHT